MVREVKAVKDALDTTFELSKLLKYSAKRTAEFDRLKKEIAPEEPGFRTLCPTRWTVRASSLHSVLVNYEVLQASLDRFTEMAKYDHEMSAKCNGVRSQLSSFLFLFGVSLGHLVLQVADNLSVALQQKSLSAADGQRLAQETIRALQKLRSEDEFSKFWSGVLTRQSSLDVGEPEMPRRRKAPARLEVGSSTPSFPSCVEDHFRPMFYQAIDTIINSIRERFDQPSLKQYQQLEDLLLKAASGKSYQQEKTCVETMWKDDLNFAMLDSQLSILASKFQSSGSVGLADIMAYVTALPAHGAYMSEVMVLLKLILVAPATNATSERSFSALRRLKTYLRSTMSQQRLNHCAMLNIMREACDNLKLVDIGNDFVSASQRRYDIFGKFC